ncbi:MAG: glutathione S-transferase family protein [Oligoflexales bacterium]|nr:glutathione S-transferase family protein [Oligoflexales bacterium]
MIKIYGNAKTRAFRPLWALEEAGLEYESVPIDFYKGEHQSEAFLAKNPGGKVPVLVDGDFVLYESAAMVTYIGEKGKDRSLVPEAGSPARYLYDQWLFFVMSELEQALWTMSKHKFALPKEWRVPAIFATANYEFSRACKSLEAAMGNKEFMVGNDFTFADLMVAHTLKWAKLIGLDLGSAHLDAYLELHWKRSPRKRTSVKFLSSENS